MAVLEMTGVSKRYGDGAGAVHALRDVTSPSTPASWSR